jgi:hypothetical protein
MRPLTVIVTSLAGASVVALGAYWVGQAHAPRISGQPGSAASAGSGESSDDNDRQAEAMGQLNRRLAALELKQVQANPAESEAPKPQSSAGMPQPMDIAAMKKKELDRIAVIDAAFKTQARDNVWSSATESQLQIAVDSAVKEAGANFSIKNMRCLTSICEMVLSASSPDQLQNTDLALGPRITGMGSLDIAPAETAADGTATVTYRLFREGYPRPDEGT